MNYLNNFNIRKKKAHLLMMCFLCFFSKNILCNQEIDSSRNTATNMTSTQNGVPVVNIDTPNEEGVSHNYFKNYNVGKEGIILNNSSESVKTELGGQIDGNKNIKENSAAKAIITEVTGANVSKIEGYTEVAGQKADHIISNPNGVYLNKAGFINVPNVTITTGKIEKNAEGKFTGYDVTDGKVVVGSDGIDARNTTKFDIISRTAELNGAIYGGKEVKVILGKNKYNKNTGEVITKDDTDDKPAVSLDAKAIGSIYAGKIYLKSTEKGVGVNAKGDMLADAGDLSVDTNGDLVINNIKGKTAINISSKGSISKDGDAISEGKISLESSKNKIENKGSIIAQNIKINGKLENQGKIVSSDSTDIDGDINNVGDMLSGKDLITKNGNIDNSGNIVAKNVDISGPALDNAGNIAGEDVKILSKEFNNAGLIYADARIDLRSDNLTNKKNIISKGTLDISGGHIVNLGTDALIYSSDVSSFEILDFYNNRGKFISVGDFNVKAEEGFTNDTGYIYVGGKTLINALFFSNVGSLTGSTSIVDLDTEKIELSEDRISEITLEAYNKLNESYPEDSFELGKIAIVSSQEAVGKYTGEIASFIGQNDITIDVANDITNSEGIIVSNGTLKLKGAKLYNYLGAGLVYTYDRYNIDFYGFNDRGSLNGVYSGTIAMEFKNVNKFYSGNQTYISGANGVILDLDNVEGDGNIISEKIMPEENLTNIDNIVSKSKADIDDIADKFDVYEKNIVVSANTAIPDFSYDKYVELIKPVDPVEPVDPVDPVGPVGPVEPVTPAEPIIPVEPIYPQIPTPPVENGPINLWETLLKSNDVKDFLNKYGEGNLLSEMLNYELESLTLNKEKDNKKDDENKTLENGNDVTTTRAKDSETDDDGTADLLANARKESKRLGLTVGVPLTEEQVKNLECDILWIIEETKDGITVSKSRVYLCEATINSLLGIDRTKVQDNITFKNITNADKVVQVGRNITHAIENEDLKTIAKSDGKKINTEPKKDDQEIGNKKIEDEKIEDNSENIIEKPMPKDIMNNSVRVSADEDNNIVIEQKDVKRWYGDQDDKRIQNGNDFLKLKIEEIEAPDNVTISEISDTQGAIELGNDLGIIK